MPRPKKHDLYVATVPFAAMLDGEEVRINTGERVRAGHPLLKLYGEYFKPADSDLRYDVEQATAAPGETRERSHV